MRRTALTLQTAIKGDPSSTAVIIPRRPHAHTITYASLASQTHRLQKQLAALGIGRGTRVSIALSNSWALIVSLLAVTWQRGVAAPIDPQVSFEVQDWHVRDVDCSLVLVPRGAWEGGLASVKAARGVSAAVAECYWDALRGEIVLDVKDEGVLEGKRERMLKAHAEDVAVILRTSGKPSESKSVPLTHRNVVRGIRTIRHSYRLTSRDRSMVVMPLFHDHGLICGLLAPLHTGGSVVVPETFSPDTFWPDFIAHKANWYTAIPSIHQTLLEMPLPQKKPRIRFIRSCSGALPPETLDQIETTFGAPVLEAYTLTEAAHQIASNSLVPSRRKSGSMGIPRGAEVRILNNRGSRVPRGVEGEICIRGSSVTKGYLNNALANVSCFTPSGLLRTRDQGRIDEDGYLTVTGRVEAVSDTPEEMVLLHEIRPKM